MEPSDRLVSMIDYEKSNNQTTLQIVPAKCLMSELESLSFEACRDRYSLLLFQKIHCGAVSIEKDKFLSPVLSWKVTRSL